MGLLLLFLSKEISFLSVLISNMGKIDKIKAL